MATKASPNNARIVASDNETGFNAIGYLIRARFRVARRFEFVPQSGNASARIKESRVVFVSVMYRNNHVAKLKSARQCLIAPNVKHNGYIQSRFKSADCAGFIDKKTECKI